MVVADIGLGWVEEAVMEMRASTAYQKNIIDEWYELLPVPLHNQQGAWIEVSFGRSAKSHVAGGLIRAVHPHLRYIVRYPDKYALWIDNVENAGQAMPASTPGTSDRLVNLSGSPAPIGTVMERRRTYFKALSHALKLGAFSSQIDGNTAEVCEAVSQSRTALAEAMNPVVREWYDEALERFRGWLNEHCRGEGRIVR